MTQPEIVQTRRLPATLKQLKRQRNRAHRRRCEGVDFRNVWDSPRLIDHVRHSYTNYERLLETLPDVEGKTEEEMMDSFFERERLHRELRDAAHVLAADMLTATYGAEWEAKAR